MSAVGFDICELTGPNYCKDENIHGKDIKQVAAKLSLAMENAGKVAKLLISHLRYWKRSNVFSEQTVLQGIYIQGQKLKTVDQFKYLSGTLDTTLSLKRHFKRCAMRWNIIKQPSDKLEIH